MSHTVYQLSPSTMESIFPKSPFLYGIGHGFTLSDARELLKQGKYRPVARFNVQSKDEVFHASNLGDESVIERIERMHSVSVGDIIEDDQGMQWIVSPMGFDLVTDIRQ